METVTKGNARNATGVVVDLISSASESTAPSNRTLVPVTPLGKENDHVSKVTPRKGKKTIPKHKTRKSATRKPNDIPRRPLSAYNYFFSEMRAALIAQRDAGNDAEDSFAIEGPAASAEDFKKHSFFSKMGKMVARRWKELSPEEIKPFTEKAHVDLARYRREMDEYREVMAGKSRRASRDKLMEDSMSIKGEEDSVTSESPNKVQPRHVVAAVAAPGGNNTRQSLSPSQLLLQAAAIQSQKNNTSHGTGIQNLIQTGVEPTYQLFLPRQVVTTQSPLQRHTNELQRQQQQRQQLLNSLVLTNAGISGGQQLYGLRTMTGQADLGDLSLGVNIGPSAIHHQLQNSSGLLAEAAYQNPGVGPTLIVMPNYGSQIIGQGLSTRSLYNGQGGYPLVEQLGGSHQLTGQLQLQLNQSLQAQQLAGLPTYAMLDLSGFGPSSSGASVLRSYPQGRYGGAFM